jgi:hypothetical protein
MSTAHLLTVSDAWHLAHRKHCIEDAWDKASLMFRFLLSLEFCDGYILNRGIG